MAVIGNSPATTGTTVATQSFNGDASTVAFTLSRSVNSTVDLEVLVDNVQQSPYDSSYSVSGTTLTFSEAPASGTNNIYVIYRGATITTAQVIPDDGSVSTAKLQSNVALNNLVLGGTQIGGRRNLIINGAMQVAQRGTSAVSANAVFPVDRFILGVTTASKFTAQQSSEAPVGFNNSLLLTSSSAYTPASGDSLLFAQRIEGYNVSQLESGTANAQQMTLSFYVRSSLTGTFAGFFANGDYNRTFPFTYTISSADTWERKTITLTADTTGTWGSTNGRGISVHWSLGIGSTLQGTANAWQAGNYQGVSGAVDLVATNGATLYITGVQLEVGTVATPFEHRSYGEELALCQRYLQRIAYDSGNDSVAFGYSLNNGQSIYQYNFRDGTMRSAPTITTSSVANGFRYQICGAEDLQRNNIPNIEIISTTSVQFGNNQSTITANRPARLRMQSGAFINFDAEL